MSESTYIQTTRIFHSFRSDEIFKRMNDLNEAKFDQCNVVFMVSGQSIL